MVIQETTYSIYPRAGVYYILSTEDLTVNIYAYSDTAFSIPLRTYTILNGIETNLEFCEDGRYNIVVTNGVFTNTHLFIYYPYFEEKVRNEMYSFICTCTGCPDTVLNDCDDCVENDECKNTLAFLSYIIPHMYLYTDQSKQLVFENYMQYALLLYSDTLTVRYTSMFWHGDLKGNYPFVIKDLAIYYVILYLYYYFKEYSEDTDSDYVDEKYKIVEFKKCLAKIGLFFNDLYNVYINYTSFGKYYVTDLSSIVDPCSEIIDLLYYVNIEKEEYEAGINISITGTPQNVILITPKSWGPLSEILDDGGANLITDTTRTECGVYYLYTFDYLLPPNSYPFKIVI